MNADNSPVLNHPARDGNGNQPGRSYPHALALWKPLLAFALFALAAILTGHYVFQQYREAVKDEKRQELRGIAELKAAQIGHWIAERKSDAQTVRDDYLFVRAVDDWLRQGAPDGADKEQLIRRLMAMQHVNAMHGYTAVQLFDNRGRMLLSSSPGAAPGRGPEKTRLLDSMRSGRIEFSDIHREKLSSGVRVEIELIAPLMQIRAGETRSVGAVLFRIDPDRFLFPLIQDWPTTSASAESLLIRREGNEGVFLNELRHIDNTALTMHFPLAQSQSPAAMAATGAEGLMEGMDYRGIPVIAVSGKVEGTPWFLVSKIDKAEMFAPINRWGDGLLLLTLLFVASSGAMALYWRKREIGQLESEIARQRLLQQLNYLSKFANDIILLADESGNIVDFNDRALEAYGYSAGEFSKLTIFDLWEMDLIAKIVEDMKKIHECGALRFESVHVRKNGESFPVESSVRAVDIGGRRFQQAIIRDISERKKAEEEISRQKRFIRQVIDSDPNLIFVNDASGKMLLANEATAKFYGRNVDTIVRKYNWELIKHSEMLAADDRARREVLETRREGVAIETATAADGKIHILQTIRKPLVQDDGSVSILSIAMDITGIKEAESGLRRLNRTHKLLGECNAALIHITDENALLAKICELVVETGGYRMAWVGFAEHGPGKPVRTAARCGHDEGYLDNANISWDDIESGQGPTGSAIRTGTTQINQDFETHSALAPWREAALARGYRASIALPLRFGDDNFGALTIYAEEVNAFNAEETGLLEDLVGNLSYGITALRMAVERRLAEIQFENERIRLRTLVQAIPDMVWLKDEAGAYMSCNYRFEQFFGAKEADIIGKTDYDFVDREVADMFREHDRRAMLANKSTPNEEWLTFGADGYHGLFETIKTPMRDSQGRVIGVLGVARDITKLRTAAREIRELNADLDATLKAIPDVLFELDRNGVYVNIWTQNPELLAAQKELLLGRTVTDMLPPAAADTVMAALREAEVKGYSHGQVIQCEVHGQERWLELSTSVKVAGAESAKRFIMLSRNITERKRTELELRFKNTLLTTEQEASIDGILVLNEEGRIISHNRRFVEIWGVPAEIAVSGRDERVLQTLLNRLVEPAPFVERIERLYSHREETSRDEIELRDGRVFEYYTTPMIGPQQEYYGRIWYFHDITEQKLAAKNLAASYAQLQQLSLHIENVKAEERAKIALYLHDEMGATLAALKMSVAWLASKLPTESPQLVDEAAHIAELLSGGIQTLRGVVTELQPNMSEEAGIETALRNYLKRFQRDAKVECKLELPERELQLDGNQSATLFRILQESLTNVAKHAGADKVDVLITQGPKSVIMTIEDNGIGFDLEADREQSFGLLGISERALMVGGYAKIGSKPGKGTRVTVCIPSIYKRNLEQKHDS
ncbi:MAG: PAS domain S-box protein [Sideroxyarcus sp.]|nr:PAS domain S-box protein [Sideroxyarcus sp.]